MRFLSAFLGVYYGVNGLVMLSAPVFWYQTVPGVTATGPFNGHFVRDVGVAFMASASAFAVAAMRGRYGIALRSAAVFLAGHAVLHLPDLAPGGGFAAIRDAIMIVVPGVAALVPAAAGPRGQPA
jgi:hypothetical protein